MIVTPAARKPGRPALGLDLGGTKIEALLLDAQGREGWRHRVDTPSGNYDATLQAIDALVQQARREAGGQAVTLGIGTPGTSSTQGRIKNANSTCLNGRTLQADLQALLGQAVHLANDANCLALSEAVDGAGAGADVVFAVILGTGVGAGIAVHGRVLAGPNGLAGEWGHNPLPWATGEPLAEPCYCGKRGCIEAVLSGPALSREHARLNREVLSAKTIHALAADGDHLCRQTLERHAGWLARALASVINLLDPDVIVLGGGLSQMPHLYTRVPELWTPWVFSAGADEPVRTRLLPSRHGDASGVRGAAWLGAQQGFQTPGR